MQRPRAATGSYRAGRAAYRTGPSNAPARGRLATADLVISLLLGHGASAFPGMPLRPAPLWRPSPPRLQRRHAIFLIKEELYYADFSKVETGGQLPLPVRCQLPRIVLEFRCQPARSKRIKDLISHIFWTLEGPFLMLKRIFPLSAADRDRTRHDPILARIACHTDRAAPVWRGLRWLEFPSATPSAIEQGFDSPQGCASIASRARWGG